jgi:uncharacterized protein (TIGR00297 family)
LDSRELKRKAVHAGMGLFALLLRWIDWKTAAALAAAALLFNLFVMPRIGRGIYRDASKARDPGIVAYPAMVLVLIVLFRQLLPFAAALWGMMALGDPAATIAGKTVGGPRLPWNPKKTWAGLGAYAVVGTVTAVAFYAWVGSEIAFPPKWPLCALLGAIVIVGALFESWDTGLDDNWLPPIPCAVLLPTAIAVILCGRWRELGSLPWPLAIGVNAAVALAMAGLRLVAPSGAVAGAIVGSIVLAFGGWGAYAILWAFFALGTAATRIGYRRKEERRTAQAGGGRRGARHVMANCGVAAFVCASGWLIASLTGGLAFPAAAFAGAFAAALADTLGTEIGSLYGRRPVSPLSLEAVPSGTPGAVSIAGLAGGFLGAGAIGAVAASVNWIPWLLVWAVVVAGLVGSLAESVLSDAVGRRRGRLSHEFANVFNTFVGAVVAAEIAASVQLGRIYLPFDIK